eukprot:gene13213-4031_t
MAMLKDFRYSHADGLTFASYNSTGEYMLTSGIDGDVRVYKSIDDDDAVSFRVGNCVTAIAVKGSEIAVATETNDVRTFLFPEGTQQDILLRFTAQVNSISYSHHQNCLVAGASDFAVKVINQEDGSHKQMSGHEGPILCVVFSPNDKLLLEFYVYKASSSCDGALKIWNVDTQECLKTLNILPKCNDISSSKILCKIAWCNSDPQVIAVPSGKGVKLISAEDWRELCFMEGSHTEVVSIVSCSPCGPTLASSSVNGEMVIWDLSKRKELQLLKHENGHKISSIDWHPKKCNELLIADFEGQFGICKDAVPADIQNQEFRNEDLSEDWDIEGRKSEKRRRRVDDSDEDDEEPVGSVHKKHRITNIENFLDDEADDDDDDPEVSINLIKEGLLPAEPQHFLDDADEASLRDFIVDEKPKKSLAPQTPLQKAFQPGSTPVHLLHRYMVWNSVGIIRSHSEDDISTIDIEFHDANLHHPLHITNVMNHSMAALSTTAAVLACDSQDDVHSKFVCLHFGTWDSTKEWSMTMPKGEEIKSVAVNSKFIAVATDARLVRLFTVGGLQYHIFSIPGPVVAMSFSETQMMIVYHQGTGLPSCQCLGMQLLEIGKTSWKLSVEQQLPISKKSNLIWIGFSSEETPFTVDSRGIVRMFQRTFGCTWAPVINLKSQTKAKSDNYWIIEVTENPAESRPVPCSVPFKIPVCDKDTEKGQLEQSLLCSKVMSQHHHYYRRKRMQVDEDAISDAKTEEIKLLMKLFALSCKSDRIFRAVEICELMPNADTVSLAIQYATAMKRMNLAERLGDLARRKAQEEDERSGNEEEEDDEEEEMADYQTSSYSKEESHFPSIKPFANRNSKTLTYNKKRSIGRPQIKSRLRKESSGDSLDGFDDENGKMETDNKDEDDIDNDIALMDAAEEAEDYQENDADAPTQPAKANSYLLNDGRSNPFKLTPNTKAKALSSSKGTSYFESLTSTLPPKNKPVHSETNKGSMNGQSKTDRKKGDSRQATLFQKTGTKSAKAKEEGTKPAKNKTKTGFLLFREHVSTEWDGMDAEEIIKKALAEWKQLSGEEKQTWNAKAKNQNGLDDRSKEKTEKSFEVVKSSTKVCSQEKEKIDISTKNSKSKLAAFAFQKA